MISLALKDKTVEISSINVAMDTDKGLHQLWANRKDNGKSFKIIESIDGNKIAEIQSFINKAVEEGELLADLTKEVKQYVYGALTFAH